MKKIYLLMLCAFLFSCKPTTDGGEEGDSTTNNDEKEYVDLGLPSCTLWATCNVGASNPEEFGKYFAWGEITTKDSYTRKNSLTNGITMNDISANSKYDAATANWGKDWRMPTKTEMEELYEKCTWVRASHNGINGYKVLGPNGNSIFLPAAGEYSGSVLKGLGVYGCYFTSTPNENNTVYSLTINDWLGCEFIDDDPRYYGWSIRAVRTDGFEPKPQYAWVTTVAVTEMTDNYAVCGGEVTRDNGLSVTARGVCWSTKENPTLNDSYTTDGSGLGSYTSNVDISSLPLYTNCFIRAYATTSAGTSYGEQVLIMKVDKASGEQNGHEYVDLGLSSGLKWAACNVGASSPVQYGDYYAWGETTVKETYTEENSITYGLSTSELQSQGYIDSEGNLTAQYDAATANWGGTWRMPTDEERKELEVECTWTWIMNGYKVTGPNGNSIFLPAAGKCNGSSLFDAGSSGNYWSSTPCDGYDGRDSYHFQFDSDYHYTFTLGYRYSGHSVRPVLE